MVTVEDVLVRTEYLVTAKASNTQLTLNQSAGSHSGISAAFGEGDLISIDASSSTVAESNITSGGVTGSVVISNTTGHQDARKNVIRCNTLRGTNIGVQSYGNGYGVYDTIISGNLIENTNQIGAAGPTNQVYVSAISVVGGMELRNVFVDGNVIVDDQAAPTTPFWLGTATQWGEVHCGHNSSRGTINQGILNGLASITLNGWGAGATYSGITEGRSLRITITAGASPSLNPNLWVNMPATGAEGTPNWITKWVGGTGAPNITAAEQASTAGQMALYYFYGTPVAGKTYIFMAVS